MLNRSAYHYSKTMEIAKSRPQYGYQLIHILLRSEGWRVNQKQIYRIYKEEGLNLRYKRAK